MQGSLTVGVSHVEVHFFHALQKLDQLDVIRLDCEMKQRVVRIFSIFEAHQISTMLLHLLELIEVSTFCCSLRRLLSALTLLQMVNHLRFCDWRFAEGTLLNVLDAVVIVQLKRLLGHLLRASGKRENRRENKVVRLPLTSCHIESLDLLHRALRMCHQSSYPCSLTPWH